MKTFNQFTEAVGFGGKVTPDNDPKKAASAMNKNLPNKNQEKLDRTVANVSRPTQPTKPKPTKPTPQMNSDVEAARRRRKAREANARPAAQANTDVQAARDRRQAAEKSRMDAGAGRTIQSGQQGPKTRTQAVGDQRDAQVQRERDRLNKPQAQAPKSPAQVQREKDMKKREDRQMRKMRQKNAQKNIQKRKSGISGGIKSALGGDVIGMRAKPGDSKETKAAIARRNRENRSQFAKKKVQQTGNLVKDLANTALEPEKDVVGTSQGSSFSGGATMKRRGSY